MAEVIAFIGGGNMAGSLIGGLLAGGHPSDHILVAEPDAARASALTDKYSVQTVGSAADIADSATTLVLAVKPQQMRAALHGLEPKAGTTIVSIAAGIRVSFLQRTLGSSLDYVRSMPNTPALYGSGVSGLFAPDGTSEHAKARAELVLGAAGKICWLDKESDLDAVTAVSGSGPAYFFLLVEAMRDAGTALGLDPDTSAMLAAQTCIGAASMIQNSGVDVAQLRAQVTSKGGTTQAALESLEGAGLRAIMAKALASAQQRSMELGDALDDEAPSTHPESN